MDGDDLPACSVLECSRKTKYTCVVCFDPVCNVCSTEASGNAGYCEEAKRIGICRKCSDGADTEVVESTNEKGDELKVVSSLSFKKSEPKAKKQKTLHFFAKPADRKSSSKALEVNLPPFILAHLQ